MITLEDVTIWGFDQDPIEFIYGYFTQYELSNWEDKGITKT